MNEMTDQLQVIGHQKMVSIEDLPEVVFEYILSQLSPYRQLIDCKLVSKSWRLCVIGIQSIHHFLDLINDWL